MERSAGVAGSEGITVVEEDGAVLVVLRGEIDAGLRPAASQAMATVLGCSGPVTIDASGVTFIDSSGLAFLLQLQGVASRAGRAVALRDPSARIRDLLALVALDHLFPVTLGAQGSGPASGEDVPPAPEAPGRGLDAAAAQSPG